MLNRVLYIYIFDVVEFIYYLSFYCFGMFSSLMEPLEAAVLLNSFVIIQSFLLQLLCDHPEFLISSLLWSVYSLKHSGFIFSRNKGECHTPEPPPPQRAADWDQHQRQC